ncbi:MAG: hypothetical protein GC185_08500 [Alphaproteobacteria bacterium]|nr:hypothetical protein [Alphaproteobacteria bacterium]
MADNKKKLKLVEPFNENTGRTQKMQTGYEKIDDDRVVERYFVPILWTSYSERAQRSQVVTTLYDFKSFTATIYSMTLDRDGDPNGNETQTVVPFAGLENKQAVLDARRALIELGGQPAEVEEYLNVATTREIKPMRTLQMKKPANG